MARDNELKCGYIAILGATNAGKSTLLNAITGTHAAIVSHKVQTTRFAIRGVKNAGTAQLVFIDTPGIFDAKTGFDRRMVSEAWGVMDSADAVLYLADAAKGMTPTFARIAGKLKTLDKPTALALNKVDLVKKTDLLALAKAMTEGFGHAFDQVFMISSLKGDGLGKLIEWAASHAPARPWEFPRDATIDLSPEVQFAEFTREQVYRLLHKELPYIIRVETDSISGEGRLLLVRQTIYTSAAKTKGIILGAKGSKIKEIGAAARKSIERATGRRLHLSLEVAVDKNWRN
ncbi:MAG: GTPase Era [Rickettsiales bacterium]|nr:GTPase Era [Rickettsiales bacterium]